MIFTSLLRQFLVGIIRFLIGATPRWAGSQPSSKQRIYFANHSSHIDTLALWAALPPESRASTRPVAALDYWGGSFIRRCVAVQCLNAVLVDRERTTSEDPLKPLIEALECGDSLILFPEGTRTEQALPGPFKSGLYRLAARFPRVELVPVYLDNLHRSLPKGSIIPLPIICSVRFGAPLLPTGAESKQDFLNRARRAVVELA